MTLPLATTYSYDAQDELAQAGSVAFSYDANGNQTEAGSTEYTYDLANRLVSATSGGETTTYAYDGDGNRLRESAGSQARAYLWDTSFGLPQLALERDGQGTLLRRYVYGLRRISLSTPTATSYYHSDSLGSVVALSSASGQLERSLAYEPFGLTRTETQEDPHAPDSPFRFAGELRDATGLYYLRARQYDPRLGRFLQVDPPELRPPASDGISLSA
jgi:RHS repeat-associated protein